MTTASTERDLPDIPAHSQPGTGAMRLLHVIHSLSPADGGPPENLRQLGRGYAEIGTRFEVLTQDAPDAPFLASYPFPVHALGPVGSTYGHSKELLAWLRAHIRDYDGVVVEGLWQYLGVAVRKAAREAKVPYAVFTHGMLDPWFARTYPFKHLRKYIYWFYRQYAVLRDAHRVIFTTEQERVLAPQTFSPHRWESAVVPLGTSRPDGDGAAQIEAFYGICPGARGQRFILFLGRIHEKKGCDLLLEAFARVAEEAPDLHLVVAGPDQQGRQKELQELIQGKGLGARVHWPGMLEGDRKWGAFRASEAFILPSHQENFGIAIAEAIGCGKPALITNKINIWDLIAEDQVGFVAEDTVDGTVELLRNWIGMSEAARAEMVARTGPSFDRRFSTRRAATGIRDLFAGVRAH